MEKDFTLLINAKLEDFHTDFKESFAKLDTRYNDLYTTITDLTNTVKMLTQQQQRMHDTLDAIQNNLKNLSPCRGGYGRT